MDLARGFLQEAGRKCSWCVHHIGSRLRSARRDVRSHRVTKGYPLFAIRAEKRAVSGNSANTMGEYGEVSQALHRGTQW